MARNTRNIVLLCAAVFLLACFRFYPPYEPHRNLYEDHEAMRVAREFAESGRFANPFAAMETGPTAHVAPGYPLLIGSLIRLTGTGPEGRFAVRLLESLVLAAQVACLPLLMMAFGLRLLPSASPSLLALAAPWPTHPTSEANYAGLLFLALTIALVAFQARHEIRTSHAVAVGFLTGTALLFSPLLLPVWACFAVLHVARMRRIGCFRLWLAYAVVPFLVISPWLARNYLALGHFVFIRGNLGLELAISNNDCAEPTAHWNIIHGCYRQTHPEDSIDEARLLRSLGEVAYYNGKLVEAVDWAAANPGRFIQLTSYRTLFFWNGVFS